jgi:hypothetical protein
LHGHSVADQIKGKTITKGSADHKALKEKDTNHQGYEQYNSVRIELEKIDEEYNKSFIEAEKHATRNY